MRVDSMSAPTDLVTIKIDEGYFYAVYPLALQFRNPAITDTKRFNIPPKIAILSTGLSYNLVPASIQERFFSLLLEGVSYELKNGVFYTDCTTKMADVEVMVEGCDENPSKNVVQDCTDDYDKHKKFFWMQFSAQDMIIDTKIEDLKQQLCIINFLPNKDDFWVFGQGFYTDYYVVHEPIKNLIRIAPTDTKMKPKLRQDSLPPQAFLDMFSLTVFVVKIAAFVLVTVAVVAFAMLAMDNKQWGGIAFLNQNYNPLIDPGSWGWVVWLRTNIFVCF